MPQTRRTFLSEAAVASLGAAALTLPAAGEDQQATSPQAIVELLSLCRET